MTRPDTFFLQSESVRQITQAPLRLSMERNSPGNGQSRIEALRTKLIELLGTSPERVPLDPLWEPPIVEAESIRRRFTFSTEPGMRVPGWLVLPRKAGVPCPVAICLQGHTSGMHLSLGEARSAKDQTSIQGGRDFAIQAVSQGYAALVIEQRGFGERRFNDDPAFAGCHQAAMTGLLTGRPLIGQRIWDVQRTIDLVETLPEVNAQEILCIGNSGGGTVSYYAAAVDRRITRVVASCSVCSYAASIGRTQHCACNYIPGVLQWFEMGDLAALIAPRPLLIVAGRDDQGFPLAGVRSAFHIIRRLYQEYGAGDKCALVIGKGGHQFYPEQAWSALEKLLASSEPVTPSSTE